MSKASVAPFLLDKTRTVGDNDHVLPFLPKDSVYRKHKGKSISGAVFRAEIRKKFQPKSFKDAAIFSRALYDISYQLGKVTKVLDESQAFGGNLYQDRPAKHNTPWRDVLVVPDSMMSRAYQSALDVVANQKNRDKQDVFKDYQLSGYRFHDDPALHDHYQEFLDRLIEEDCLNLLLSEYKKHVSRSTNITKTPDLIRDAINWHFAAAPIAVFDNRRSYLNPISRQKIQRILEAKKHSDASRGFLRRLRPDEIEYLVQDYKYIKNPMIDFDLANLLDHGNAHPTVKDLASMKSLELALKWYESNNAIQLQQNVLEQRKDKFFVLQCAAKKAFNRRTLKRVSKKAPPKYLHLRVEKVRKALRDGYQAKGPYDGMLYSKFLWKYVAERVAKGKDVRSLKKINREVLKDIDQHVIKQTKEITDAIGWKPSPRDMKILSKLVRTGGLTSLIHAFISSFPLQQRKEFEQHRAQSTDNVYGLPVAWLNHLPDIIHEYALGDMNNILTRHTEKRQKAAKNFFAAFKSFQGQEKVLAQFSDQQIAMIAEDASYYTANAERYTASLLSGMKRSDLHGFKAASEWFQQISYDSDFDKPEAKMAKQDAEKSNLPHFVEDRWQNCGFTQRLVRLEIYAHHHGKKNIFKNIQKSTEGQNARYVLMSGAFRKMNRNARQMINDFLDDERYHTFYVHTDAEKRKIMSLGEMGKTLKDAGLDKRWFETPANNRISLLRWFAIRSDRLDAFKEVPGMVKNKTILTRKSLKLVHDMFRAADAGDFDLDMPYRKRCLDILAEYGVVQDLHSDPKKRNQVYFSDPKHER